MTDETQTIATPDAPEARREGRRDFFRAFGVAAAIGGGMALTSCGGGDDDVAAPGPSPTPTPSASGSPTPTPTATSSSGLTDADIMNFALNLDYLQAQFYAFATTGSGLPATLLTGPNNAAGVAATGARQVTFADPVIGNYAREIAQNKRVHVEFLRAAVGATAIAAPAIDLSATATGAFSAAARAAGLVGAGQAFDPYASDDNFLLAAFLFADLSVTAYKGAAAQLSLVNNRVSLAGILAADAYHAAMIRGALYARGLTTPSLINATEALSNARDALDGASDIDQGVRPNGNVSNIMPLDANGIAFGRSFGQVLNIAFLNRAAVTSGGFFPSGVNGTVKTSAAN